LNFTKEKDRKRYEFKKQKIEARELIDKGDIASLKIACKIWEDDEVLVTCEYDVSGVESKKFKQRKEYVLARLQLVDRLAQDNLVDAENINTETRAV